LTQEPPEGPASATPGDDIIKTGETFPTVLIAGMLFLLVGAGMQIFRRRRRVYK